MSPRWPYFVFYNYIHFYKLTKDIKKNKIGITIDSQKLKVSRDQKKCELSRGLKQQK